jgi:hypothetical protein
MSVRTTKRPEDVFRKKRGWTWFPHTGFRSPEIVGLDEHIATDPPLYRIEHRDTSVSYLRVYATSPLFVEGFICMPQGDYILVDATRQVLAVEVDDIAHVSRKRAKSKAVTW